MTGIIAIKRIKRAERTVREIVSGARGQRQVQRTRPFGHCTVERPGCETLLVFLVEGTAELGRRNLMATIIFDLGFAILGILARRGTVEDPFESVAERHIVERRIGSVVDTRFVEIAAEFNETVEGASQLQTNPTVGRDAEDVQARRAGGSGQTVNEHSMEGRVVAEN
jgi:hypothetical protein